MDINPRPQFEVRRVNPAASRRKLMLVLLLVLAAALAGAAAGIWWADRSHAAAGSSPAAAIPMVGASGSAQAAAQEIATSRRSEQVARIAAQDLRKTLADREQEISALRADLAFYSNLVGSGDQGKSLSVHGVHIQPIDGSRAWNVTVTLTQNARRGEENRGRVKLAVEGVRGGKLSLMKWEQISAPDKADGIDYAFKYFQQLHISLMLPEDFTPNRLRVMVNPSRGKSLVHSMTWSEALKSAEENNVQQ